jgi:putative inorganic carbon (HCO3(-)) transporter
VTTPVSRSPRTRRWGVRLVVAGLVTSVLAGNSALLGLPIPPERVLLAGGFALLALDGHLPLGGRGRWRPVHTCMAATLLWALWSAWSHGTLFERYGAFAYVDRLVVPFLVFVLAPLVFRTREDLQLLMRALCVLGIYLGVTGVFEMLRWDALVFPPYVMDPSVGILFGRARGPFVEAEADGMTMAACLFVSGLTAARSRGTWRVVGVVGMVSCAVGVVLSLTRSVWLGTVLGLLAVVVTAPAIRRRALLVIGGAGALVTVLIVAVPGLDGLVQDRLAARRSLFDRENTNAAALRILEQHPLDGVGWARFQTLSADWVRQAPDFPITNVVIEVHNVVLARAAELGLVGVTLWVGCVLAGPGLAVVRRQRHALLAGWRWVLIGYGCVWLSCVMVSPVSYVLPNDLLWLFAGIVLRPYLLRPSAGVAAGPPPAAVTAGRAPPPAGA